MPAKAEWLLRVPEILTELRVIDVPVLDRATIQRLFNFQRRRAIQFMHAEGGYQAGNSFSSSTPCRRKWSISNGLQF